MSEIDDVEKGLKEFAALRQKCAGSGPLQMPGPVRERLRVEIESMNDCDSIFERKSGFQLGTLLRILIPTAAVAAVALVSFQSWDSVNSAPSGDQVTASLQKEKQKHLAKADEVDSKILTAAADPVELPASEIPSVVAKPIAFGRPATASVDPRWISSTVSTRAVQAEELAIVTQELKSIDLKLEKQLADQPVARGAELPLAQPGSPGYGEPREATLAPTVPANIDDQLSRPLETLRFHSTAPGTVLSQFVLRRTGDVIELIDADGSRYLAEASQLQRNRAAGKQAMAGTGAFQDGVAIEHFVVAGINQTTGREVKVIGSIFHAPLHAIETANKAAAKTRIHAVVNVSGQNSPVTIEAESD